jgi:hypothetical protein
VDAVAVRDGGVVLEGLAVFDPEAVVVVDALCVGVVDPEMEPVGDGVPLPEAVDVVEGGADSEGDGDGEGDPEDDSDDDRLPEAEGDGAALLLPLGVGVPLPVAEAVVVVDRDVVAVGERDTVGVTLPDGDTDDDWVVVSDGVGDGDEVGGRDTLALGLPDVDGDTEAVDDPLVVVEALVDVDGVGELDPELVALGDSHTPVEVCTKIASTPSAAVPRPPDRASVILMVTELDVWGTVTSISLRVSSPLPHTSPTGTTPTPPVLPKGPSTVSSMVTVKKSVGVQASRASTASCTRTRVWGTRAVTTANRESLAPKEFKPPIMV